MRLLIPLIPSTGRLDVLFLLPGDSVGTRIFYVRLQAILMHNHGFQAYGIIAPGQRVSRATGDDDHPLSERVRPCSTSRTPDSIIDLVKLDLDGLVVLALDFSSFIDTSLPELDARLRVSSCCFETSQATCAC